MVAQLAGIVLGIWLMVSPEVLGYWGAARISSVVAGALAASLSWIALSEVTRPLRRLNVAIGIWVLISAFVLAQPGRSTLNSAAAGVLLALSGLLPSRIKGSYGGGWSAIYA